MTRSFEIGSRSSMRNGLTLIEVVAAAALLGSVLVGAVVGFQRHRAQLLRANERRAAADALDEWMAEWFSQRRELPIPFEVPISADERFVLRGTDMGSVRLGRDGLIAKKVQLSVCSRRDFRQVWVRIEILVGEDTSEPAQDN